jgi:hypothetical protein
MCLFIETAVDLETLNKAIDVGQENKISWKAI